MLDFFEFPQVELPLVSEDLFRDLVSPRGVLRDWSVGGVVLDYASVIDRFGEFKWLIIFVTVAGMERPLVY